MEKDLELLNKIYTKTELSSKRLNCILSETKNSSMRKAIISQINEFDKINSDAKSEIANLGHKPKSTLIESVGAKIEAKINMSVNPSDSHIAEIIIKSASSDVVDITKSINTNQNVSPNSYSLGRKLIKKQEENIETFKTFL